jgi:hypothetical protein
MTTQTTIQLTLKEIQFLECYKQSDYYDGMENPVWDYSIHDNLPYAGKTRSGVVSSLSQKNIITVYKKERDDIAGTYQLTAFAINNNEIQAIFNKSISLHN